MKILLVNSLGSCYSAFTLDLKVLPPLVVAGFASVEGGIQLPLGRYRIKDPSTGLFFEEGRRIARTLPAGAVIKVDNAVLVGDQLVDVLWEDQKVLMFTQDLLARAEREP